ncbi:hypothetical protein BH10PAT1_BH10PAT1_4690 [soil metagenome]
MHNRHLHRKKIGEYLVALLFIILIFYLGGKIGFGSMIDFIKDHYFLGIIIYFVYATVSNIIIFLPLVPLMPIASYLYGFPLAIALTVVSTLIGASVCFLIGKIFGKKIVIRIIGSHLYNEVDHLSQMNTFGGFLLIRVLGNNYYDLISYIAGLSKLNFKNYFIATAIGTILWNIILFFLIEKSGGLNNISSFLSLMAVYGVIVLIGTIAWELYHKKHTKKK